MQEVAAHCPAEAITSLKTGLSVTLDKDVNIATATAAPGAIEQAKHSLAGIRIEVEGLDGGEFTFADTDDAVLDVELTMQTPGP